MPPGSETNQSLALLETVVADSKKLLLLSSFVYKNAGSHILETVADSDCSCRFSCRFKNTS